MTIEEARNDLLNALNSMDKDKLSLLDLKLYAETLKTLSEIQTKSYAEALAETMRFGLGGMKTPTVSDLK